MPLINCVTARKLPNLCASISSSVFTIITHGQHLDMLPVITFIIITDSSLFYGKYLFTPEL